MRRPVHVSPEAIVVMAGVIDVAAVAVGAVYLHLTTSTSVDGAGDALWAGLVACLTTPMVMRSTGLYRLRRIVASRDALLAGAFATIPLLLMIGMNWSTSGQVPREGVAASTLAMAGLVVFGRLVTWWLSSRGITRGFVTRRIGIVGAGGFGASALRLLQQGDRWISIEGVFDHGHRPADVPEPMVAGDLSDLDRRIRSGVIDEVIIALPPDAEDAISRVWNAVRHLSIDVRLVTELSVTADRLVCKRLSSPAISGWPLVAKRTLDLTGSCLLLVALTPLMLAIAIAIRLETPGPTLFRQTRRGINGRLFEICKFRTMYHEGADYEASKLVERDDIRVTAIGRLLRMSSLDELPQLFNVIRGEMSLVGPRPHALRACGGDVPYDRIPNYAMRHRVKPGITGWAQVNGWRGNTDTELKIRMRTRYDLHYIESRSFVMDLYILLRTLPAVLSTKNAF